MSTICLPLAASPPVTRGATVLDVIKTNVTWAYYLYLYIYILCKYRVREIIPSNSKLRLNRTRWSRVIAKKNDFQYGVRPPPWIGKFLIFGHVSVAWDKICASILNFVQFRRFEAEIWRYNDFQNWWPSAMLYFRNATFSLPNLCVRAIELPNSKFRLNRTVWSRIIAKKLLSMASLRHLEFVNFWNFLTFPCA